MALSICFAVMIQLIALPIYLMGTNYDTYLIFEGVGGSLIYGMYVIIDLKLISEKIAIDDYILGAVTLYVDLITLFVHILRIVGKRK